MTTIAFTFPWAITILVVMYYVSSALSARTRTRIGTMIFFSIFILAGYWTVFPKDIIATSQIPAVAAICNLVLLVDVGASFDVSDLKKDWRVAVATLAGSVGMAATTFILIPLIFNKELAIATYPTMVGGLASTNIINQVLVEKGATELAATVVLTLSMQMFVGIPMMTHGLRKECNRLLVDFRQGNIQSAPDSADSPKAAAKIPLVDRVPPRYNTSYMHLSLLLFFSALATTVSTYTARWTNGLIGMAIIGIVFGIVFKQLGLLAKQPLTRAGVMSFFMMAMMINLRVSFANITPMGLVSRIVPIMTCLVVGGIGVVLVAVPVGKKLGFSPGLVLGFAFGSYTGYPLNFQVAMEVIDGAAQTPEEHEYLKSQIIQKVIIGGIVSVSLASVVIAGVVATLL